MRLTITYSVIIVVQKWSCELHRMDAPVRPYICPDAFPIVFSYHTHTLFRLVNSVSPRGSPSSFVSTTLRRTKPLGPVPGAVRP